MVSILQELARGTGGDVSDSINLDVHAINELKSKEFPFTNDKPKYNYKADDSGQYSEYTASCLEFHLLNPCKLSHIVIIVMTQNVSVWVFSLKFPTQHTASISVYAKELIYLPV